MTIIPLRNGKSITTEILRSEVLRHTHAPATLAMDYGVFEDMLRHIERLQREADLATRIARSAHEYLVEHITMDEPVSNRPHTIRDILRNLALHGEGWAMDVILCYEFLVRRDGLDAGDDSIQFHPCYPETDLRALAAELQDYLQACYSDGINHPMEPADPRPRRGDDSELDYWVAVMHGVMHTIQRSHP